MEWDGGCNMLHGCTNVGAQNGSLTEKETLKQTRLLCWCLKGSRGRTGAGRWFLVQAHSSPELKNESAALLICPRSNSSLPKQGSLLLLLLISSLLLCNDVTSLPLCEENCGETYGHLLVPVVSKVSVMHFYTKKLFIDFVKRYSKSPDGYFQATIHTCHTCTILESDDTTRNSMIPNTEDLRCLISLMNSWNELLLHLANEAHRLPGHSTHVRDEVNIIAGQNRELQNLVKNIATQFDPDFTKNVDYAVSTDFPSLQSADEDVRLFTTFNLLRCLLSDTHAIAQYLKLFLCSVLKYDKC
ncbi:PREDICTED: prolactin-like [Chinchilla lanigera]|uniref:prolactin-like n=1 Tax=Chinchilla lanigera TaxID=34839 RepID=UPI00038EFDBA|nr:PREDICTED: prolactin-like [Chinchilla lanigera]